MKNPVIATVKCIQCSTIATVHQVARGRGRRLMFYTNCPACKCDQRTGREIQDYVFNNASARPGYESVFEGQVPPAFDPVKRLESDLIEENEESIENNDLIGQDDKKTGSKTAFFVVGLFVTSVLTVIGLSK